MVRPSVSHLIFLSLLILISCAQTRIQPESSERVVEKFIVQCQDGSIANSIANCPHISLPEQKEPTSPTPEVKRNETINPPKVTTEKTLMQTFLDKSPKLYWFSDGLYGAITAGDKRSTGEYDPYWNYIFRLMYWDSKSKTVYVLAPYHVAESWWLKQQGKEPEIKTLGSTKYLPAFFKLELTGDKIIDKARIPIEFNKYWYDAKEADLIRIIKPVYIKSPTDWMNEYADAVPLKIDNTSQTLPWRGGTVASKSSIYYRSKEDPQRTIVFRFDSFSLPLVIDELDSDGALVNRMGFDFDTTYYKQGKTNVKLTPQIVELPKDSIIITVKQFEKWMEEREG